MKPGPTSSLDALVLQQTPDAVILTRPDGRIQYWGAGAEAVFGYRAAEVEGRQLNDLIVPADRLDEEAVILSRTLSAGLFQYESLRRRKDGSLVYVDISSKAIYDADGRPEYVLSTKKDITMLKLERDAKRVEAQFRDLLDSTPDGIVMVNPTGRIVIANKQAEAMFHYAAGELRGQPIEVLLPSRFRQGHVGHRSNYFAQSRVRAMGAGVDLHGVRKNGEEFPVEVSLSPLKTEESTLVMSAIRDVSDRKRIERALQDQNIELNNAIQAKDRFLASMSHELRTPLNAIIGFTSMLLMKLPGPLTGEQDTQLRLIKSSANHLLSLINDLLDLAKIESGKVELHLEPVDGVGLLEEIAATLQPAASAKGLTLDVVASEPVTLRADRRALSQIVINLTNNAIKFTEHGGVRLELQRRADDPGFSVRVIDSGTGIRADEVTRLFQPFAQLGGDTARLQEGTGLGLHVSQRLAGLLGGRIRCDSVFGSGSTFTLDLPGE